MMKMVKKLQVVQDQNIHGNQKLALLCELLLISTGLDTNTLCNIYHMMYNRVWKKEDVV